MPNPQSKFMFWSFSPEYQGRRDFIDPRVVLARYLGWKKTFAEYTDYSTPEPDNYNRAVFQSQPTECALIEDQVIFYDSLRQGWITLMYIPREQLTEVNTWITQLNPQADWRYYKAPQPKPNRHLLWTRHNFRKDEQTENERLYTMGYYENLKSKYFSDDAEYVDSLLGTARAVLENFVPEEQNDEVDDFSITAFS